jgi:hypothetical protein
MGYGHRTQWTVKNSYEGRLRRMPTISAMITIPHKSTLPEDTVVNTFHFMGADDVEDMAAEAATRITSFYEDPPGILASPVGAFLSNELAFEGARIKIYDMADPKPRVPVYDESASLAGFSIMGSFNLPGEVSTCLSYSADTISGGNPRRRRGRIYLGPLNDGAMTKILNDATRPLPLWIGTLAGAGQDLANKSTVGCEWAVYSRAGNSSAVITHGFVDNAFDTQRRRGVDRTSRFTWTSEPV